MSSYMVMTSHAINVGQAFHDLYRVRSRVTHLTTLLFPGKTISRLFWTKNQMPPDGNLSLNKQMLSPNKCKTQLFSFNFGPQLRHTAHAYSYDEKTAVRSSPNLPCFRITTVDILLHLIRCLLGARSVNSLVVLSADWRLNHCALTLFHSV